MFGRNLFIAISVLLLLASIPLGVYLVRQQMALRTKAATANVTRIEILGNEINDLRTTNANIKLQLVYAAKAGESFPNSYRISNYLATITQAPEQPFNQNPTLVDWQLEPGIGPKTIYVQFKVNDVWVSQVQQSIILDDGSTPLPNATPEIVTVDLPTPTPKSMIYKPGKKFDLNDDKVVDNTDIDIFLERWRSEKVEPNDPADFNNDGRINNNDYAEILKQVK